MAFNNFPQKWWQMVAQILILNASFLSTANICMSIYTYMFEIYIYTKYIFIFRLYIWKCTGIEYYGSDHYLVIIIHFVP